MRISPHLLIEFLFSITGADYHCRINNVGTRIEFLVSILICQLLELDSLLMKAYLVVMQCCQLQLKDK
ncbi:hypothetical protein RchiOBHm_Chr6g0285681 [Rosa chinensis]|uniref:Uncharacterized protein n=1 Tax=Rosa chinensis TaxID=74649 RepID=A0A2P6PUR5_ROSCH|nr:hypothetical protein RchiOBHm_Chr6g0285681 [Rosa chinensis]